MFIEVENNMTALERVREVEALELEVPREHIDARHSSSNDDDNDNAAGGGGGGGGEKNHALQKVRLGCITCSCCMMLTHRRRHDKQTRKQTRKQTGWQTQQTSQHALSTAHNLPHSSTPDPPLPTCLHAALLAKVPPPGWPAEGGVTFRNVVLRYRPNLEPALKSFNLTIRPGEKLGICGRTGAGKSTIISALFRLFACEQGSEISLDGVNLFDLPLHVSVCVRVGVGVCACVSIKHTCMPRSFTS